MSKKAGGLEDCDGSPSRNVQLPYPETSALPDVGKIMKDLGIESNIPQNIPEGGSADVFVKPGGLGFDGFLGGPSEDMGFPSCEPSGEFPNVEKIMKDLSIESPVSHGIPEAISAPSNILDSPSHLSEVGFKEEVLNKNQDSQTNKSPSDAAAKCPEKKPPASDPKRKAEVGKPS